MVFRAAVERFCERIVQRCEGIGPALQRLRTDPQGEGIWLDDFVDAFFQDSLLDNPGGACFVLHALERRPLPERPPPASESDTESDAEPDATIGDHLDRMARRAFADLLAQKSIESLSQHAAFEA